MQLLVRSSAVPRLMRPAACRDVEAAACDVVAERNPQRRRGEPGRQPIAGRRPVDEVVGHVRISGPEQRLELAELRRLEAARRVEPGAEAAELERGHRLEHVHLGDHHLEDAQHPVQRVTARDLVVDVEHRDRVIELPQHLLEPQLVHLVDHDEQHLVVLGAVGSGLLERQQFVDLEVRGIRQRGMGHALSVVGEAAHWPHPDTISRC